MLDRYLVGRHRAALARRRRCRWSPCASATRRWAARPTSPPTSSAMGATCLLVGVVGDDTDGAAIRQELAVARLEDRFVIPIAGRPTTSKTRIIARSQQIVRIDDEVESAARGPRPGPADPRRPRGAGRRGRAAARGLQQGRAAARAHRGGHGDRPAARHSHRGGPQVPPVLRVCRRHRVQAQPPRAGVGAGRGGGPAGRQRAARGAHPAQGGQPAGDAGRRGDGAGDEGRRARSRSRASRARSTTSRAPATRSPRGSGRRSRPGPRCARRPSSRTMRRGWRSGRPGWRRCRRRRCWRCTRSGSTRSAGCDAAG